MAVSILKHRWQKITLISLAILAFIVLLVVLFLNSFLTARLSAKLKEVVLKGTDSLYHINFSKAELHLVSGSAVLYDITFSPDTAVYHRLQQSGHAPNNLLELKVKRLEVSNAHPLSVWLRKKAEIGLIRFSNPEVYISRYADKPHEKGREDKRTLYQKISKSFRFIHVGKIQLDNVNFTYRDKSGPKPSVSVFKEIDLQATDLLIDSASQTDTSRTLYCRDIVTELKHYTGKAAGGLYTYKIRSVKLSTRSARLDIAGVDMQPLDAKTFFAKSKGDRFSLHLDTITFHHFDYRSYRRQQNLYVSRISIYKGAFGVFGNPDGPLKTTDRLVTFPNWAIRQLKTGLQVDTLDIKNIDMSSTEFKKNKSGKIGTVRFENVTGRFLNITNSKAILQKHPLCTVNLSTMFMGKGKLNLTFNFNLADEAYSYSYKGHLGAMDMQTANPAVMPLGMVRFKSGTVKSLDFDIRGNQKISTGKVTFLYHNLGVEVLKRDEEKGYAKRSLISLFANAVVLKNDNPEEGKLIPRVAEVAFIRPKNFPFFKTIWLALLSGIKGCAGIGRADEKTKNQPITQKEREERADALKKARENKEKEDKKFREKVKS